MKRLSNFILVLLVGMASTAQASSIDNLSTHLPTSKIDLPKTDLVYLKQIGEGTDPFGRFEEGLDPANENPLAVSNKSGKIDIDIDIAGSNWVDGGKDSYNEATINVLEFSTEWQRYVITNTYKREIAYQIIVNVDRKKKHARVYMREAQRGKLSDWRGIVEYGK